MIGGEDRVVMDRKKDLHGSGGALDDSNRPAKCPINQPTAAIDHFLWRKFDHLHRAIETLELSRDGTGAAILAREMMAAGIDAGPGGDEIDAPRPLRVDPVEMGRKEFHALFLIG